MVPSSWLWVSFLSLFSTSSSLSLQPWRIAPLEGVKNFRPALDAIPGCAACIYRSAALEAVSESDATQLLNVGGRRLTRVIDLRNVDEIEKGRRNLTAGGTKFYAALLEDVDGDKASVPLFENIPLLDAGLLWEDVADAMPLSRKLIPSITLLWSGHAMDAALTRELEIGGLPMLYRSILRHAKPQLGLVLDRCLEAILEKESLIFHCQKGKDRTGLVAALLQIASGMTSDEVVRTYMVSGDLLGGEDSMNPQEHTEVSTKKRDPTRIDWSRFRGSPALAMESTLRWLNDEYGSTDAYLDNCGFVEEKRELLRKELSELRHDILSMDFNG